MCDVIAQTQAVDASWIITGMATAFVAFASFFVKCLTITRGDLRSYWEDFRIMHKELMNKHDNVLKEYKDHAEKTAEKQEAMINAQKDFAEKVNEKGTRILSKQLENERHLKETKYSIQGIHRGLKCIAKDTEDYNDLN